MLVGLPWCSWGVIYAVEMGNNEMRMCEKRDIMSLQLSGVYKLIECDVAPSWCSELIYV